MKTKHKLIFLVLVALFLVFCGKLFAADQLEEKQIWNNVYDSTTQTIKVG